jgi:hypothetical protein
MKSSIAAHDWPTVAETLVAFGAPLGAWSPRAHLPLEQALVAGLVQSRADATVLRALPVVLLRNWRDLAWPALEQSARQAGVTSALGMLVELTAKLAGVPDLEAKVAGWPRPTRDPEPYFPSRNRFDAELVAERTPAVARAWGFLMNVGEDSFRRLLETHVGAV